MKSCHRIAAFSRQSAFPVFVALVLFAGSFIEAAAQGAAAAPLVQGSNSAGQLGYANPIEFAQNT